MITEKYNKRPRDHMPDHTQPIGEWFKLFLKIVEDEGMLKELRKRLKVAVSMEEEEVEQPHRVAREGF